MVISPTCIRTVSWSSSHVCARLCARIYFSMCAYVNVLMHAHVCLYVCVCAHACTHACTCNCVCISVCVHLCVCAYARARGGQRPISSVSAQKIARLICSLCLFGLGTRDSLIRVAWLAIKPLGMHLSLPPHWGCKCASSSQTFYLGARDTMQGLRLSGALY